MEARKPFQAPPSGKEKVMGRILILLALLMGGIAGTDRPGAGFTAEFTATRKSGWREPIVVYREVRTVSASGSKKVVQQAGDGRIVQRFIDPERGVLVLDESQQHLVRVAPRRRGEASALGEPRGRATVLGYETDVYEETTPGLTTRYYRAPGLNGEVIKIVRETAEGTFILEPTRITPGEPAGEVMALPDVPIVLPVFLRQLRPSTTEAHDDRDPRYFTL
jgi:hypothetical protein